MSHKPTLRKRIEDEVFFPNGDGPSIGNAAAFRDYRRRILAIVDEEAERLDGRIDAFLDKELPDAT
jgi:hypothetical protein